MMFAGKDAAAQQMIELRVGVPARNKNTLAREAVSFPQNSHAMRGILAIQAQRFRYKTGANMFQPNQTDAGNREPAMQLWFETRGQLPLHDLGINAEICQDSSADDTLNDRQLHVERMVGWRRRDLIRVGSFYVCVISWFVTVLFLM